MHLSLFAQLEGLNDQSMQGYVRVASLSEVLPGKCKSVEAGGNKVVLVNSGGTIFALEDSCSHLGAPLSLGYVTKTSITCEWHGACFDLKTGEAQSAPATESVPVFEVRIVGEDIEVLV